MKTFFFYDLETSGFSPRDDRIMQFAGQRTDLELNPIGDPINILVKLNDDVLPSPSALMVTKISPQKTVQEGYSETEFAKLCQESFFTEDTIAIGYNNIRFDDEHMRYLFWRNFYDPYEWQWKDGRSRWDMLDVVRMVRALRPEGINWPFKLNEETGEEIAINKLELLTKENGIEHENAHDALADVVGLIEVAKLIKQKQPQIFNYLLKMRQKANVQKIVNLENPKPFIYSSGRYSAKYQKTTVAFPIAPAKNKNVIVWDLRVDPTPYIDWDAQKIAENITSTWEERQKENFVSLPIKTLQYNRCPAVALTDVLTKDNWQMLELTPEVITKHMQVLANNPHLVTNIMTALEQKESFYSENEARNKNVEARLYDSFIDSKDKIRIEAVRNAGARELADFNPEFDDERLPELLLHYKARNFNKTLTIEEKEKWEKYRAENIQRMLPNFKKELVEVSNRENLTTEQKYILEEINLWLENILPDNI